VAAETPVPSAVSMSNVMPVWSAVEAVTVNVALTVPLLPSITDTLSIDSEGTTTPPPCGVTLKSSTARP